MANPTVSGAVLSIRAHRSYGGHFGFRSDNWSVQLRLQASDGPARLVVRLCNFRDQPVFEVFHVSRVQFVPTAHDEHKFNLRLFESEGEGGEGLVTGERDSTCDQLLLSFSRPRPILLIFEEEDVLASRASWRTDVGWQLLRYADGLDIARSMSFFWQAAADPSRDEELLLPQPAEPPAEQHYDISELLAAAQLTDTEDADKINEWRCAICHDGVAEDPQLASAHAPGLANGTLHVFHRQCLEEWRAYSSKCPTCKTELSPRPLPAAWSATTRLSAPMAVCLSAACWSMPNPYLTTQLQSGFACGASEPRPRRPALRVKHLPKTLAPKRQPPRPPRPPGDGCADDQQWDYSWRLVVPVGSQPGEWPQDSALELAEESLWSVMENDADTQDWVREEVIRHLEALFVPVSAQDAEWWTRLRNTYEFQGHEEGGAVLGDSNLNKRHLLYVYFRNDGRRVARDSWEAGRQSVTSVSIRYRGPAQFRLRHPRGQDFTEYRLRPNEVSPIFGF
jgi:hypothetical protein